MGKSRLVFYLKEEIRKKYIMELKIHRVEDEFYYDYKSDDKLIEDFKKIVLQHFGEKI